MNRSKQRRSPAGRQPSRHATSLEWLEQAAERRPAQPVISEFMASNDQTLNDGDGHSSDWIEIFNAGDETAHLLGWHLTDNVLNLNKWSFPDVTLEPVSYLVVFASQKPNEVYVIRRGSLH